MIENRWLWGYESEVRGQGESDRQPLSLPVGDELRRISLNVSPTNEHSIGEQEC
jgi:hypothetical protein